MAGIKPVIEFILWNNCNNNCSFCFQKHKNCPTRMLNKEQQLASIKSVRQFIKSEKFIPQSHILLVGGEIFDIEDSDIKTALKELLVQICYLMRDDGKIDLFYINTNLIYKNTEMLYWFLALIDSLNLFHRLKFTTSYDQVGRFKRENDRLLMLSNLGNITTKYKKLKIVVNVILTRHMCKMIQTKDFDVTGFEQRFGVTVNLIPYIILIDDLATYKQDIFDTILAVEKQQPGYQNEWIRNLSLNQPKYLYEYIAGDVNDLVYCSSALDSDCGHSVNFKRYEVGGDSCFICDMRECHLTQGVIHAN